MLSLSPGFVCGTIDFPSHHKGEKPVYKCMFIPRVGGCRGLLPLFWGSRNKEGW